MSKYLHILFIICMASVALNAEPLKKGYYDRIDGKSDSDLKNAICTVIRPHTAIAYGSGMNHTWEVFYYSDRDTATGLCMDMYCDSWKTFPSVGGVVSGCNIEHSFAKSWWGGAENDAYKDCYHLNPSNKDANSGRSNYPLGVPVKDIKTYGSLKVGKRHHNELNMDHSVFEPKDEYKGDFARAYFYMATCYGNELTWRLDNKDVGSKFAMDNSSYLEFQDWEIEVLLKWHRMDPVSTKELDRMDAVSDYQHNRNPFIDYPELVEYIWGNKKGQEVDLSELHFTGPKQEEEETALETPEVRSDSRKCIMNGQLIIMVGDRWYTADGRLLKQ